jgi:predicted NAD/FAD-binding protein
MARREVYDSRGYRVHSFEHGNISYVYHLPFPSCGSLYRNADLGATANFINFLEKIKVATEPTEMTFGVSRDFGRFEWAGTSIGAVFCQWRNIFSPRMWRMVFDIIRFNQFALDLLMVDDEFSKPGVNGTSHSPRDQETIGEYLDREGYSDAFRDDYLLPMTAAVWSTSPDKCSLEFPAITLVRFM